MEYYLVQLQGRLKMEQQQPVRHKQYPQAPMAVADVEAQG